jgi:NitT/TauT family transport system substrate-binding protein
MRKYILAALLAAAASGLLGRPAAALEKLDLALNWVPGGDDAPLYYAKKLGRYKDAGIDLVIEAGKGSGGSLQRVAVNSAQLGIADMGVVLNGHGKGADVVAILNLYANSALGNYWLKSSGIRGVKDFVGKRIGVPAGDTQRILFPALAKANGIDPNAVTWVNIEPNAKLAALKAHSIDVTTNFYNLHAIMSRELGADMGFLAWRDAGINPYGLSFIVNGGYVKSHRETIDRFTRVTQRAYAECVKTPQPCIDALIEAVGSLRADNEMVNWQLTTVLMSDRISRSTALGWHDDKRMADDYQLVDTYLTIEKKYDVREVYTNDFLDTAVKMTEVAEPKFD